MPSNPLQRGEQPYSKAVTIDGVLSAAGLTTAKPAFDNHGITDLWLPLPRQTLRHLLTSPRDEKSFFNAQLEMMNATLPAWDIPGKGSRTHVVHATLEDGDHIVLGCRTLGEGAVGIVEEVTLPTNSGSLTCVRKKIGRPKQLKVQKQVMAAFAREIKVMRQVDDHHCVRILGSYTDLDSVNILLTPVADMDLATFLDQPLSHEQRKSLYKWIHCLCNGLKYLHHKKIRHEDLKPQNVLIRGDNILLADFGFSLDFSDDSISTTTGRPSAWTVRYSAPEVLEFEPRNRASDIFSLGCVLYEMISGIDGHRLSEVKDSWKQVGNGQSSFARNWEAAESYLEPLESTSLYPKLRYLRDYIPYMLNPERDLRPSAKEVADRLSDWSFFLRELPEDLPECCHYHFLPKRSWVDGKPVILDHKRLGYFYPGDTDNITYLLLDLDFHLVSSELTCYDSIKNSAGTLFGDFGDIMATCFKLYNSASRTGTTKDFWESHRKSTHSNLVKAGDEVEISTKLLSLKHVVFTTLRSFIRVPSSLGLSHHKEDRYIQISLLPVCFAKSSVFGGFFYMVSFSEDEDEYSSEEQDRKIVDLTII
ncbi:Nn.00g102160.m01.CDS01 [Neocucurbitaria sp. VM-36]